MTLNQLFSAILKIQDLDHAATLKVFAAKGLEGEELQATLYPSSLVYLDLLTVCVRYYEHREGTELQGYPETIAFFDSLPIGYTSIEMQYETHEDVLGSYEFWVKTLREVLRLIMDKNDIGVHVMHLSDLFRGMLATDLFAGVQSESDYTPEGCAREFLKPFRYYPGIDAQVDAETVLYSA